QTDLKSGAHLFGLDLPEAVLDQALTKLRRQDSGSDFQRPPLHEIVCISGLWIDEQGMKLFSFIRVQHSEAEILRKFLSIFDKRHSALLRWNSSQLELPVLFSRSMYLGPSGPSRFNHGESVTQKRYKIYQNRDHHRHVDVIDVMDMLHARHFQ